MSNEKDNKPKLVKAVETRNEMLKDYIGHKAKVRVEGATTADVTLVGLDQNFLACTDADGRLKFHQLQFVREVFPQLP